MMFGIREYNEIKLENKELKKIISDKDKFIKKLNEIIENEHIKNQISVMNVCENYERKIREYLLRNISKDKEYIEELYKKIRHIDYNNEYELEAVKELIPCNIYKEFYYNGNEAIFEDLTRNELIEYYEIVEFAKRKEKNIDYKNTSDYIEYKQKVHYNTVLKIIKNQPVKVLEFINITT